MADGIAAQASIQRRLLRLLIVVMLIVVACAAAVSYFLALSVAQSAYDRSLPDPAFDIAANIRVGPSGAELDMLAQAQEALLYDREDTVVATTCRVAARPIECAPQDRCWRRMR